MTTNLKLVPLHRVTLVQSPEEVATDAKSFYEAMDSELPVEFLDSTAPRTDGSVVKSGLTQGRSDEPPIRISPKAATRIYYAILGIAGIVAALAVFVPPPHA